MLKIKWLGQAGYELWDGRTRLMIDPYLSDSVRRAEGMRRLVAAPYSPQQFCCDGLFCTHDHADHLDYDFYKETDLRKIGFFAGPDSCILGFGNLGVRPEQIRKLNAGSRLVVGRFDIRAVYAKHTNDSIGLVVTFDGIMLYFSGDSLYDEKVGNGVCCDIIFVCINGKLGNMDYCEAAKLTCRTGAKIGIPAHYSMFAKNTENPQNYVRELCKLGIGSFVFNHDTWTQIEKTGDAVQMAACTGV